MKISTKLTHKQTQKLAFIQEKTKKSTNEILLSALEYYYQQLLNTSENHLEKFSTLDFIGCIESEPNLAENCESILMQEIRADK